MGYWDYKHIGASAKRENKKHVEKIFDYIGYGRELDYSDGEECSFVEPDVYRCWTSDNPSVESEINIKKAFRPFDKIDLLNLLNALFPGTNVYVHSAEGNNTSDTWENHDEVYDATSMTLECKDSYTDYGGDGPTGERSWKERFALKPPEMKYITALTELSTADGNTELTALLEELAQKLRDGLIVYEDDGSDERVIGQRYDVDDNVYGEEEEDEEDWDDEENEDEEDNEEDNDYSDSSEQVQPAGETSDDAFDISDGMLVKYNNYNEKDVIIPYGVTCIGEYAFDGCKGMVSITIPDTVTAIEEFAFCGCTRLKSITLSNSIIRIADGAFIDCEKLQAVHFIGSIDTWLAIDMYEWIDSPLEKGAALFINGEKLEELFVPQGITCIGDRAFSGCSSLMSITIPDSVTSIGESAFYKCTNLTSITIPDSVTSIGRYALCGCNSLTRISIPNSVTNIEDGTFEDCINLVNVKLPNNLTRLGKYIFRNCSNLKNITIPKNVTIIEEESFCGCSNLTSISIPNGVTSIEDSAFNECSSLTSITIPDSVTSIGMYAFCGCSSLTSIKIPNNVTTIEDNAFDGCCNLISVTILNKLTSIGEDAFIDCDHLKSIITPAGSYAEEYAKKNNIPVINI